MNSSLCLLAALFMLIPSIVWGHAGEKHKDKGVTVASSDVLIVDAPLPINVGGPFSLTDHSGNAVTNETYLGKHMLVFFGYTNCQVMCSISLDRISGALRLLEKDNASALAKLAPLIVTVDPNNDTPATLKASLVKYHPALIGLTGSPDDLDEVYKAYKQSPSSFELQMNGKDVVVHTSYFYLMNPDGEFQTLFPPILNSESMASILKKYTQSRP